MLGCTRWEPRGPVGSATRCRHGSHRPVTDCRCMIGARCLTQAMLMLAGGSESCADIEALCAQDRLFGHVPSDSTVYRTFRQIDPGTLGRRTTGEALAGRLRPGNAGANSTSDHLPHEISRPPTQVAARGSGSGVGGKGN